MRNQPTLVVLTLLALAATARAQEGSPAPSPAIGPAANVNVAPAQVAPPVADTPRKLLVGVSFLPMGLGKFKFSDTFTSTSTQDAYFAYGIGVSGNYEVLRGLYVGFAPQVIFNVQAKPNDVAYAKAMREYDFIVRVAYAHRVVDTLSVYAELLPGYSLIVPSDDAAIARGLVLGFGVGVAADITDRYFMTVGGGYQFGFQSQHEGVHAQELRARYVRVAMGGGVRF